jgi:hypothetical protein
MNRHERRKARSVLKHMATVDLEIKVGKGAKATTHNYKFDGDDVPLLLLEAQQEGKASLMREALTDFLELPEAVARQLTIGHIKQIGAAIKEATESPNA